jgi:hypothetical protein
LHLAIELRQIYIFSVTMRIWHYFSSFANLVDWINFITQLIAWYYWYVIHNKVVAFEIDSNSYQVLADPQGAFRPFTTDAHEEYQLLKLIEQVETLGDLQGYFSSFSGISIILLVFKLISSLDFQPKMGIITRTLARAGSNMAHYMALYSLVFIGYAVVGNLMFGSLFSGMATFSDTCQTLMFFMLAFDPSKFFSQMNHAITHRRGSTTQPGTMEYNVYLWSYMFINSFILMNIFLAILVSAYDDIAKQSEGYKSVLTDLRELVSYYAKMALLPSTHFISDDEMVSHIRHELNRISGESWGETELNTRANAVRGALAPMHAIVVGRGVAMEKEQIRGIVERLLDDKSKSVPGVYERMKRRVADWQLPLILADVVTMEEGGGRRLSSSSQINLTSARKYAAVDDLMTRLGTDMRYKGKEMTEELTRLMQVEGYESIIKTLSAVEEIKSQLKMADEASHPAPDDSDIDPKTVVATIEVTAVSAKNLPRMDVLSSCDAYCMVFLNEDGGGGGLGPEYMQFMSQMRTTREVRSRDPVWEHTMTFDITHATRSLVLSVWDRDQISADDLVGCVELTVNDIINKEPGLNYGTRYYPLIHARHSSRLRNSFLCARIVLKYVNPAVVRQRAASPGAANPGAANPGAASPGAASSRAASPDPNCIVPFSRCQ